MQEIHYVIDEDTHYAKELVLLRIRNQQAYEELQSYNDNKRFKLIHPLTINQDLKNTQRDKLKTLKENNPSAFLNEIANLKQNIRRIESQINNKKYKDLIEYQSWLNNLEKAKIKHQIILELI